MIGLGGSSDQEQRNSPQESAVQKQLSVREDVADGDGGLEGPRQVESRVVGQGIGQGQAQRGGGASRSRAGRNGPIGRRCAVRNSVRLLLSGPGPADRG